MNRSQIENIIPHRPPFLFVDEIVEITEDFAKGLWKLTGEEQFFKGHFPGIPVCPGVLLIEAAAQVGAVILLQQDRFKGKIPLFGGVKNVRFRRRVVPGDTVEMNTRITKVRGPAGIGASTAYVGKEKVLDCELLFYIGD